MHAGAEPHGETCGGEFLEDLEVDLVRLAPAAVLLGVGQAQESRLGEQPEGLAGEDARGLLLRGDGLDLPLHQVADEAQQVA